jgi:CheY-like chemotaxis protein
MPARRKFLIVDDNADGRFLLAKTLLRRFPQALVHECQDLEAALEIVRHWPVENPNAVAIAHRAGVVDGRELCAALRREHATVPIIWVSGIDRTREIASVGATRFLPYDAWLTIGNEVDELLGASPPAPLA